MVAVQSLGPRFQEALAVRRPPAGQLIMITFDNELVITNDMGHAQSHPEVVVSSE